jgi:hypothetical protein
MSHYENLGRQHHQYPESGIEYGINQIEHLILGEIEDNFNNGLDGSDLIKPLIDSYTKMLHLQINSIYYDISIKVLEKIETLEKQTNIIKNKQPLYFLLALMSIKNINTTGALLFWELSQIEYARVNALTHSVNTTLSTIPNSFKSIYTAIEHLYNNNIFISFINSTYNGFNKTFEVLLSSFNDINKISLISCGMQNVETTNWMHHSNNSLHINRLLAQELINSLCILSESFLKSKISTANNTFGSILNNDLPIRLSAIIGNSNMLDSKKFFWGFLQLNLKKKKVCGLFKAYRTGNVTKFNTNFVKLLNTIYGGTLTVDQMEAHVLYGAYMVRNASLHQYNENLVFYNNKDLFQKTIGLLFISLNVIDNL